MGVGVRSTGQRKARVQKERAGNGRREAADDEEAIARLRHNGCDARGGVTERPRNYRKRRDVFDEPVETVTRPCLRCRTPIESEGPHHRLCYGCANSDVSPYAV